MDETPASGGAGPHRAKPTTPTPAKTPVRRATSVEPSSARRGLVHTPLDRTATRDLVNSVRRGTSASGGRRNNAPTPHAKAARRALDQRRTAMFTPGRNRRRSLMEQRETPMGLLKNLGKVLAPKSRPIVTSSSPRDKTPSIAPILEEEDEDDDDDLLLNRPRLSLPIDEEDDDDSELRPPRLSGVEEENYTVRSVELPRRAVSEQPVSRLSRGSFGSVQPSDIFEEDELSGEIGQQSDFFPGLLEDLQARAGADADNLTYERVDIDPARRTTLGRESDFGLEVPAGFDDQTTFLLSEPPADGGMTSPMEERSVADAVAEAVAAEEGQPLDPVATLTGVFDDVSLPMAGDDSDANEPVLEGTETTTLQPQQGAKRSMLLRRKQKRVSRYGTEYPPLPASFVKKVAQTALQSSGLSNNRVSADTLVALTQASDWFFEQLGDDLGAYANHAKRKTIEESDVLTLMKRQRQVGSSSTMFSLAQKHLPRELLQELRMPVPQPAKQRRGKRRNDDTEDLADVT